MNPQPLLLVGGGGHAKVIFDTAQALGMSIHGVYDDAPEPGVCASGSVKHLGAIPAGGGYPDYPIMVAMGDLDVRERCIACVDLGQVCRAIVHPSAVVSPSAVLGAGVFVGAGAIINADASIGAHSIINTGAIVEHDCVIGCNVHVGPRATLGGGVVVEGHSLVGIGSSVLPGVHIGFRCVVGGGSVVIDDVGCGECVVGNPGGLIGGVA